LLYLIHRKPFVNEPSPSLLATTTTATLSGLPAPRIITPITQESKGWRGRPGYPYRPYRLHRNSGAAVVQPWQKQKAALITGRPFGQCEA
jgi:hypothetical protein